MFATITASVVSFMRREDGRTAVEYAIVVNLVVLLVISGITASGPVGKRTVFKVCDRACIAYQSTQATIYSFLWRHRSASGTGQAARR